MHLTDRDGQNTGVVYGVLLALEKLAGRLQPEEMVVCWDRGIPLMRAENAPEYKADRGRTEEEREFKEDVRRQLRVVEGVLGMLPVIQVGQDNCEADDVIDTLCRFLKPESVGVVTADRDIYPAVASPRHRVFNPDGTPAVLVFEPEQYLTYNMLVGGKNNLSGIAGVGKKTATDLICRLGSLDAILAEAKKLGKLGKEPYGDSLLAELDRLQSVMRPGFAITEADRRAIVGGYRDQRSSRSRGYPGPQFNIPGLKQQLRRLGFSSLLARFRAFTFAFSSLSGTDDWIKQLTTTGSEKGRTMHGERGRRGKEGADHRRGTVAKGPPDSTYSDKGRSVGADHAEDSSAYGVGQAGCRIVIRTGDGGGCREDSTHSLRNAADCYIRLVRKTGAGNWVAADVNEGGATPILDDHGTKLVRRTSRGRGAVALQAGSGTKRVRAGCTGDGEGAGPTAYAPGEGAKRSGRYWQTGDGRRRYIVAMITSMTADKDWLSKQPTESVAFLRKLVMRSLKDDSYRPTRGEEKAVEELHADWCGLVQDEDDVGPVADDLDGIGDLI